LAEQKALAAGIHCVLQSAYDLTLGNLLAGANGQSQSALPQDRDSGAIRWAAHLLDRLIEGQAVHLLVVELGDDVVGHHAGFGGGRLVDRSDHLHQAVFHRDLDAEPAEFAAGLHLEVTKTTGIHVARMRIEPSEMLVH